MMMGSLRKSPKPHMADERPGERGIRKTFKGKETLALAEEGVLSGGFKDPNDIQVQRGRLLR